MGPAAAARLPAARRFGCLAGQDEGGPAVVQYHNAAEGGDGGIPRESRTLGIVGIAVGAILALLLLEFVGPFERNGWKVAPALAPVTYIAWLLWLMATGVAMLL